MNLRDRYLAALKGEPVDRIPLSLDGFFYNGIGFELNRKHGYLYNSHSEIDQEPDEGKREITHRAFDRSVTVLLWPSHESRYFMVPPQRVKILKQETLDGIQRTTSIIDTPKGPLTSVVARDYTSWEERYPVQSREDIDKISSLPWEPPPGLCPPDLSALPDNFKERCVLQARISSPFVCVAGMMPYQFFLELCAMDLDLIRELSIECGRRILQTLDLLLAEKNVDIVWLGGCEWITPPMGSPEMYEILVQEFEREIIERIHAAGALCHLHCHGNVRSTIEQVIMRGADFFEPVEPPPAGDIEFSEAKALVAGRMCLGGNIESDVLATDSVQEVERAALKAFEGDPHPMVVKPSVYPLGRFTPRMVENYHRFIDVWEENA